jgi:uncharacterized protein YggE
MKYLLLVQFILSQSLLWAQVSGNVTYQQQVPMNTHVADAEVTDQEINISVSGLLNAKADTYVAFFHVMQVGETAEATDRLMRSRIAKFKNSLAKSGVDTMQVHTDVISFVPKYDFTVINKLFSKTYNEVPDGFELQKNVVIRYKNASDLDAIITAATTAEIYDLVKVDYFLNDVKKYYHELRQQCVETLKDRIKSYELLGIKLDTLKKSFADDFGTILPQGRYGQYQAVARPSISAVKKAETGTSIKFRSADLSPSRFYQAVSYDGYDVVINPVVDEPMVQLTYQLEIKFILTEDQKSISNYLFMGPNGQWQKVDLNNP